MGKREWKQIEDSWILWLLSCVVCFVLAMTGFMGHTRVLVAAAAIGCVLLFAFGRLQAFGKLPVMFFLAYFVFSGMTGIWAFSGKFFLREFSKLLVAAFLFLLLVSRKKQNAQKNTKHVMALLAGVSAIFGILSVEAASTGMMARFLNSTEEMAGMLLGFEAGTRLTGILGNANILSSILALGILFSLALVMQADLKWEKIRGAALLAINAFTMILCFSMGAIACFCVAILVYLLLSGADCGKLLLRMLEGAIPSLLWGFLSFPFFGRQGGATILPLLFLLCNIASVIMLEQKLMPRLFAVLQDRQIAAVKSLVIIAALLLAYVAVGLHWTGSYTFGGESLRRAAYPEAGVHCLSIEANDEIMVEIICQNRSQVMMHEHTTLYQGTADGAEFQVPENSEVCYFIFSAPEGVCLEQALLDDSEALPLEYYLFPGFVENRVQGLKANQNAIQRTVFFKDGLKLFRQHPILGCGLGAFESGVFSVQEFYYETRFVHNHYIQVLLDSGLVGFLFFMAALLSMVWFLWKRGSQLEDGSQKWFAALSAALVMIAAHSFVEVSLSDFIFMGYAYLTFAMICANYVPDFREERATDEKEEGRKGKQILPRLVLCSLPLAFLLTLGMNQLSRYIANRPCEDMQEFLDNMVKIAKLDPYEANDAKLTYVFYYPQCQTEETRMQADVFAEELLQVQSNSIPSDLVRYYLFTEQYVKAIDAAKIAASYCASDHEMWNSVMNQLYWGIIDRSPSPLSGEGRWELIEALLEYFEMLEEHNANSMEPIRLDPLSQELMDSILG